MRTLYQTIDGKFFKQEHDAKTHELQQAVLTHVESTEAANAVLNLLATAISDSSLRVMLKDYLEHITNIPNNC